MAKRYAHCRQTYAPKQYNDAIDMAIELGMVFEKDGAGHPLYALDGQFEDPKRGLPKGKIDVK